MVRCLTVVALLVGSVPSFAQAPSAPPAPGDTAAGPAAASAPTQVAASPEAPRTRGFIVELAVGGAKPTSKYDFGVYGDVGVAYRLPWLRQRLGVGVDLGYLRTGHSVSGTDPRVTADGGAWSADVGTDVLVVDLTVFWRFFDDSHRLVPYAGIGPAVFMLRDRPQAFSLTNTEQSTQAGLVAKGGLDFRLGPGALFAELRGSYAPLNRTVPGDHNLGGVSLAVGYRVMF